MSKILKLLIGAVCAASTAQAVTLTFSGVVIETNPALAVEYPVGASFEIEYVFAEPLPPSHLVGPPGFKAYFGDVSFSVSSGHGTALGGTHQLSVENNSAFVGDELRGDAEFLPDSGIPMTASGQLIDSFSLFLRDDDSVAFSSDDLVQTYDFSAFETTTMYVSYSGGGLPTSLAFIRIDDFQIVPEPSAAVLLGLSVLGLFRRKR